MAGLLPPRARVAAILILGASSAAISVAAADTAGEPFGPQDPATAALEGLVTWLFVMPGFVILAVAARWMSAAAAGVTLLLMIALSVWASLQMWNAVSALEGLTILILMLGLPPIASAGTLLDIGGRALARKLRPTR